MKLQITALALSLTLAIPTLAQDIPLSQAESVAKSVTPDSTSAAFNHLQSQWLTQLRKALQGHAAELTRDALAQAQQNPLRRIPPGYRPAVTTFRPGRINRQELRCFPLSGRCRRRY